MAFFVLVLYLLPCSNSLGWVIVTVMTVIATSSVLNFTEQTLIVRCYETVTDCATFPALVEANACDIQEAKKNRQLFDFNSYIHWNLYRWVQ